MDVSQPNTKSDCTDRPPKGAQQSDVFYKITYDGFAPLVTGWGFHNGTRNRKPTA